MSTPIATGILLQERYEVAAELARGGMGVVHRARDTRFDEEVVIKYPFPQYQKRFEQEIVKHRRLHHPHIVPVLDAQFGGTTPYFVMPYLSGGTLREQIGATKLGWLSPVSDALDYMHLINVVHRDVKPSNILCDEIGQPYLGDLGIALSDDQDRITGTGQSIGTGPYMAPECYRGQYWPKTDQYALAVSVYEIITGELPFESSGFREELESPRPFSSEFALPTSLWGVLNKAMSFHADARFPTCRAFADAIMMEISRPLSPSNPDTPTTPQVPNIAGKAISLQPSDPAQESSVTPPPPDKPTKRSVRARTLAVGLVVIVAGATSFAIGRFSAAADREEVLSRIGDLPPQVPAPSEPRVVNTTGLYRTLGDALRAASAGETIIVHPGEYDEAWPMVLDKPIRVIGPSGEKRAEIQLVAPIEVGAACHFENLTFVEKSPPRGVAPLARVTGSGVTFTKCRFIGGRDRLGRGIEVGANGRVSLVDCEFADLETGLRIEKGGFGEIVGGLVRNCRLHSLHVLDEGRLAVDKGQLVGHGAMMHLKVEEHGMAVVGRTSFVGGTEQGADEGAVILGRVWLDDCTFEAIRLRPLTVRGSGELNLTSCKFKDTIRSNGTHIVMSGGQLVASNCLLEGAASAGLVLDPGTKSAAWLNGCTVRHATRPFNSKGVEAGSGIYMGGGTVLTMLSCLVAECEVGVRTQANAPDPPIFLEIGTNYPQVNESGVVVRNGQDRDLGKPLTHTEVGIPK